MSSLQRLLIGFGAGCLATLFAFPATRSFLLQPVFTDSVQQELDRFPLSGAPPPIPEPKNVANLSELERLTIAVRIADLLNNNTLDEITPHEKEIALRILNGCRAQDSDNAVWPQLIAAVYLRAGDVESAKQVWHHAATLTRWSFPGHIVLQDLWDKFAEIEGRKMSWQGLLALKQRRAAIQIVISRTGEQLMDDQDIAIRLASLQNFDMMREGTNSLLGSRRAADGSFRASHLLPAIGERASPAIREKQYIDFQTKVRESLGDEAEILALTLMRRNDAWVALLKPDDVIEYENRNLYRQSVVANSAPSAFFWTGMFLLLVALVAQAVFMKVRDIPHPNVCVVGAFGVVLALISWQSGSPWLVSVWYLFVGLVLAWPVEYAKPSGIEWNALNTIVHVLLSLAVVGFLAFWILCISPTKLILENGSQFLARLASRPQSWTELAAGVMSLALPTAAVWARVKRASPLTIAAESIGRIARSGAAFSLVATVVLTPICFFWDKKLQTTIEAKVVNEPALYRVIKS